METAIAVPDVSSNGHPDGVATPRHRHACRACRWSWVCRARECIYPKDECHAVCRRCRWGARQVAQYIVVPRSWLR